MCGVTLAAVEVLGRPRLSPMETGKDIEIK